MAQKSSGFAVWIGRPRVIATAAIRASKLRACGLRPEARSAAATCPKARAACASNGSGSKVASAC